MAFDASQWMTPTGSDYEITNSIRLDRASATRLDNEDLEPTAAGRKKFTISLWFKLSTIASGSGSFFRSEDAAITYEASGKISFLGNSKTSRTVQVFRDPSAWMHLVVAVDTTQGTAADRAKIYINGVHSPSENTDFPTQNGNVLGSSGNQYISSNFSPGGAIFDGYLAEYHFLDTIAALPTAFGKTGDYGEWKPIEYAGVHGDNGWYLNFATASDMGDDKSANTNDWTEVNLAATDQMLDSPTNNFCTWNPLFRRWNVTNAYAEGNTKITFTSSGTEGTGFGSIGGLTSGKWYWEVLINAIGSGTRIGISNSLLSSGNSPTDFREFLENHDGTGSNKPGTFNTSYGNAFGNGDIISVALDLDNGTLTFFKNNSTQNVAFSDVLSAIPEGGWMPMSRGYGTATSTTNWGQDSTFAGVKTAGGNADANSQGNFFYAPVSGHLALCTANLPEPAVIPSKHFNAITYTGTGNTNNPQTVGFQPDFTWIKQRSDGDWNALQDSIRGNTKILGTNDESYGEFDIDDALTGFTSTGFTLGADTDGFVNEANKTYVAWNWKAGGNAAAVGSNTDGSINTTDTTVNAAAGFSISTYTGTGSAATVGHGLSKKPEMIIIRRRDDAAGWRVFHDASAANYHYVLNTTAARASSSSIFNNTEPTTSVFTVGTGGSVNTSSGTFVAWCFHSVEGYSKVSSYQGNNSDEGAFVYTGFKPKWIMVKSSSAGGNHYDWAIYDTARSPHNPVGNVLEANQSQAEVTGTGRGLPIDILSNGFKHRSSYAENNSNKTYIYLAFAETPFKYSNAK